LNTSKVVKIILIWTFSLRLEYNILSPDKGLIRMVTQALPVSIQTMVIQHEGMTIYFPQIVNLQHMNIQQAINQKIYEHVQHLIQQQYVQQDVQFFNEMIGLYEIKTNERNVLSLSLSNYAYAPKHAHGLTLMKSLTFDVQTGKLYQLGDLFKKGSHYKSVLSKLIQQQIKERDIPVVNSFPGILSDQDFYIADKSLVIYYQAYEFTPGYIGFPMFPISVFALQDIIDEDGPLGRMATNS